ncbi:hypothetical protein [Actinoplanes lobatus]|uniref:Uncharacterized protein n=1 Tax=Actinoplanes lobatus TaxID=113568 RepID=A0A7W7MJW4_9ACTN|nr:hypothetical protein [Actinoplanes lobatus]MBB4752475.1 hypothetical protein [Actinoplanes lobatus]
MELAVKTRTSQWVCTAAGLTAMQRTPSGALTTAFTPVAPAVSPQQTDVGVLADDYDTWCENASTCRRKLSAYIAETKGNAAYGNSQGLRCAIQDGAGGSTRLSIRAGASCDTPAVL